MRVSEPVTQLHRSGRGERILRPAVKSNEKKNEQLAHKHTRPGACVQQIGDLRTGEHERPHTNKTTHLLGRATHTLVRRTSRWSGSEWCTPTDMEDSCRLCGMPPPR